MAKEESLTFSRFIIEEKDEENPSTTIEFNKKRSVNSQYVPIRLMTNFSKMPTLYSDKQEKEVKDKIDKLLDNKQRSKLNAKINQQEDAIVNF